MAKGEYDFWILVTCLLILALQIHNPFQPGRQGACQYGEQASAASLQPAALQAGRAAAAAQQAHAEALPVSRRPQAVPAGPAGGGLSTEDLLRELDSIQVKAKEQQDTLSAAGRMPPASPVLQQIKEMEAGIPETPRRVAAAPAASPTPAMRAQAAPLLPTAAAGYPAGVPPAVPAAGAGAGAAQLPLMLQRRDDFGRFLNMRQPQGLGVILGVGRGDFALRLLNDWTVSQGVYLVDPYIHIWRGYDDPGNLQDREHQLMYEDLRNRLVQFEGRYVLVRDFSHSFAETYQKGGQSPGSPSFVYVDANPAEEAVSRDLDLWWPLLASGGILAGGSYTDSNDKKARVKTVVDRFATKLGLQVYLTHDDVPPSWFLMKQ